MKIISKLAVLAILPVFILSCSQTLVKGTVWVGKFKFNSVKYDLEAYFKANNKIKLFITGDFNLDGIDEVSTAEGTYYITDKNVFVAKTKLDMAGTLYDLDLDGLLVYSGGSGYGDYEFEFNNTEDSWTLYIIE